MKKNNKMIKISISMRDTETNKGFVKDVVVTFKKGRSTFKAYKTYDGHWFGERKAKHSRKTIYNENGKCRGYFDNFVDFFNACR